MEPIETETVDTPAGAYTIEWHYDEDAEQPYNNGLGFAFDGTRDRLDVSNGEHADEVLAILQNQTSGWYRALVAMHRYSSAGIARYLRIKYGFKGIREVSYNYHTSEPTTDRDRIYGIAWAPDDATNPDAYTDAAIAEYRAWAEGDCFGYTVTSPSDEDVDACFGFYGYHAHRDETRDQALAAVKNDAEQRAKNASLVGAGFVGLI